MIRTTVVGADALLTRIHRAIAISWHFVEIAKTSAAAVEGQRARHSLLLDLLQQPRFPIASALLSTSVRTRCAMMLYSQWRLSMMNGY